ncbi:MAG TPA: damage-inducible protein [Acetobacteraceae bacterium]|nr:damage-inducible protein [Acetobacteraceae bacterium]
MFSISATPLPGSPKAGQAEVRLRDLRDRIAGIERAGRRVGGARSIPFAVPAIDSVLPDSGLAVGALHEMASGGADTAEGSAAALFVAGILTRMEGSVLWAMEHGDLFAPGLAGAGLHSDRVVFVEADRHVLSVMEEGLRHPGLAAVVGEITGRLTLVASRRLQLAAEATGTLAMALRRSPRFDDPVLREPTAAVTRWRVAPLPSPPPLPHAPETPGLGRARWQLDLVRCRGGQPGSWIVEACDATGGLALVADMADRPDQEAGRRTGVGHAAGHIAA